MRRICFILLCLALSPGLCGAGTVRDYVLAHQKEIVTNFVAFLSIPNDASDTENIRKDQAWITDALTRRGLTPQLLKAQDPKAPAGIYAELKVPTAKRTLLLYAHYDGQPAVPDGWTVTPPWQPVFRLPDSQKNTPIAELTFPLNPDTRVYARSASDDKAGVMAILTALDAARASGAPLTSNLKFYFEGEEEAGSPHMAEITAANKELLGADAWILIDGPVHPSGRKQVDFGVRGDVNVDIAVYGPARPLHSGHYGNWAPNPAMRLAQLLASMKDDSGRVLIAGWYDDVVPLSALEQQAIREMPSADDQLKQELGIAQPDGKGASLQELIMLPSLNINGIRSADVGAKARNVIPSIAEATLDLRLAKGNDYRRQFDKLVQHIRAQGYLVLDREPTIEERRANAKVVTVKMVPGGYNAQRTAMDLPVSKFVMEAVQSTTDQPIVRLPAVGGSLPLSLVEETLGCPLISVPLANHDNNQHAENENLRMQNLWNGIESIAALMTYK